MSRRFRSRVRRHPESRIAGHRSRHSQTRSRTRVSGPDFTTVRPERSGPRWDVKSDAMLPGTSHRPRRISGPLTIELAQKTPVFYRLFANSNIAVTSAQPARLFLVVDADGDHGEGLSSSAANASR